MWTNFTRNYLGQGNFPYPDQNWTDTAGIFPDPDWSSRSDQIRNSAYCPHRPCPPAWPQWRGDKIICMQRSLHWTETIYVNIYFSWTFCLHFCRLRICFTFDFNFSFIFSNQLRFFYIFPVFSFLYKFVPQKTLANASPPSPQEGNVFSYTYTLVLYTW